MGDVPKCIKNTLKGFAKWHHTVKKATMEQNTPWLGFKDGTLQGLIVLNLTGEGQTSHRGQQPPLFHPPRLTLLTMGGRGSALGSLRSAPPSGPSSCLQMGVSSASF